MNILEPPDAYGYTTFCDDIRMEVGGKLTFVGIYTGQMVVYSPTFPAVLPKLSVSINYLQRQDRVVLPIQFRIFFPWDDTPAVLDTPAEGAQSSIENAKLLSERIGEPTFASIGFQFSFVPFVIMQAGVIKVRAVRGDQLVRLGGLEIVAGAPPSTPAAG